MVTPDIALVLAKMRADFVAELPERCDQLEDGVLALERNAMGAYDDLYRKIHSLKGSGGTFGLNIITSICHAFETFLSAVRSQFTSQRVSFALNYVDLLRRAGDAARTDGASMVDIESTLAKLIAASNPRQCTVLLLEPSITLRKMCETEFTSNALNLVTLDQGFYGITRLQQETFDLLIVSRELPDIDSLELLGLVREMEGPNQRIPVLMISSNPAPVPANLGVDAILPRKPELVDTLLRRAIALKDRLNPA